MSHFLQLCKSDLIKGLVMTVGSGTLALVLSYAEGCVAALQQNTACAPINWALIGMSALSAGSMYILKQLGTDHNGKLLGKI